MKITQVDIEKDQIKQDGLDAVHMHKLGRLVLIAGKNGSGKSRLLEKVEQAFQQTPDKARLEQIERELFQQRNNLNAWRSHLEHLNNPSLNPGLPDSERKAQRQQHQDLVKQAEENIQRLTQDKSIQYVQLDFSQDHRSCVRFVPQNLNMSNPRDLTDQDRENRSKQASNLGLTNFHDYALSFIEQTNRRFISTELPDSRISLSSQEKLVRVQEFQKLDDSVESLLGTKVGSNSDLNATLFGFPIGKANLSDGQKVLLQLAVAIHCQGAQLSDVILMLDEPENHLHPGAVIEVIEKLLDKIPDGQIWIATHSVSVLAHFFNYPEASLWFMDHGTIGNAGKNQKTVLDSLLGDSTRIQRQRDFLDEPDVQATYLYLEQCLLPPGVANPNPEDPQTSQIKGIIAQLWEKHQTVRLLDYGAGKGRLLDTLLANSAASELAAKLDYVALDECDANRKTCEASIQRIYGTSDKRWFQLHSDLRALHNKVSFDLVLLCNVLHEISPQKWADLFGPTGTITELLTEDGSLLLVEDQRVKIGEHAHEFGFIVLDTVSLKELFAISGNDPQILADEQREGRLKAHLISKEHLERVTKDTVKSALMAHQRHAKEEITRLREGATKSDGRLFAFWTIQYANATLALEAAT
ncbi:MAG TPA: AAA family ATPase [Fibrobacteraceae bacterium]|nr:AAA family ATPase [Fibrobacteraceae bacterium]